MLRNKFYHWISKATYTTHRTSCWITASHPSHTTHPKHPTHSIYTTQNMKRINLHCMPDILPTPADFYMMQKSGKLRRIME